MFRRVGFIGIGVMGRSMAKNLMKSGFDLYVMHRTKSRAQPLESYGVHVLDTPPRGGRA